jgi:serine/threonine protein kinase
MMDDLFSQHDRDDLHRRVEEHLDQLRRLPGPEREAALTHLRDGDPHTADAVLAALESEAARSRGDEASGHQAEPPFDAEQFNRLEQLFLEASELDQPSLANFLKGLKDSDPTIADSLAEMLGAAEFDVESSIRELAETADDASGEFIGPYQIRGVIGEGGFGIVHLAEQHRPIHRIVALKVIKPGMDTKAVLARFRYEMQAMGAMDHPAIPAVLDAGETPDHRPYVVMPLVPGRAITAFCREQNLDVIGRVRLLLDVCRGVQHAHARGVIHRDLKPDNILVTLADGSPRPAIIDFGLAKALQPSLEAASKVTTEGQIIGSVEYMSPEQANLSPDIDVRTDIYALGSILHELLADRPPFTAAELAANGRDALIRAIMEREPSPPSRIAKTPIPRELDWICLRCLEKEPSRRYATVDAFASDLDHFLRNEPIEAGPADPLYRLSRWTARHRVLVVSSLLILASILGGTAAAVTFAIQASADRERAEQISSVISSIFTGLDPEISQGRDNTNLLLMLEHNAPMVNAVTDLRVQADLCSTYARAYHAIGRDWEAGDYAERAIKAIERTDGPDSKRKMYLLEMVMERDHLRDSSRNQQLVDELERLVNLNLTPNDPDRFRLRLYIGICRYHGNWSGGDVSTLDRWLDEAKTVLGPDHPETIRIMWQRAKIGVDPDPAVCHEPLERVYSHAVKALGPLHPIAHLGAATRQYAMMSTTASDEEKLAFSSKVTKETEAALGEYHHTVVNCYNNTIAYLSMTGRHAEAVRLGREAIRRAIISLGPHCGMGQWIDASLAVSSLIANDEQTCREVDERLRSHLAVNLLNYPRDEIEALIGGLSERGRMDRARLWYEAYRREFPSHAEDFKDLFGK